MTMSARHAVKTEQSTGGQFRLMTANESLSVPTVNHEELPDSEDTASNNDIPDSN